MSVRQTVNGKNHKFHAEQILAIHNIREKNQARLDKIKDKYFKSLKG